MGPCEGYGPIIFHAQDFGGEMPRLGARWAGDLEAALEKWQYDRLSDADLREKLIELGFPKGYVDWFMYMVTRE